MESDRASHSDRSQWAWFHTTVSHGSSSTSWSPQQANTPHGQCNLAPVQLATPSVSPLAAPTHVGKVEQRLAARGVGGRNAPHRPLSRRPAGHQLRIQGGLRGGGAREMGEEHAGLEGRQSVLKGAAAVHSRWQATNVTGEHSARAGHSRHSAPSLPTWVQTYCRSAR